MSAADNRRIIGQAFGLARADPTAFVDAMADDITWIIEGQSKAEPERELLADVHPPARTSLCLLEPLEASDNSHRMSTRVRGEVSC